MCDKRVKKARYARLSRAECARSQPLRLTRCPSMITTPFVGGRPCIEPASMSTRLKLRLGDRLCGMRRKRIQLTPFTPAPRVLSQLWHRPMRQHPEALRPPPHRTVARTTRNPYCNVRPLTSRDKRPSHVNIFYPPRVSDRTQASAQESAVSTSS